MLFLKLLYKLKLVELAWLYSRYEKPYLTIKRRSGKISWAYVYTFSFAGYVVLREDGTTGGKSAYIKEWSEYK